MHKEPAQARISPRIRRRKRVINSYKNKKDTLTFLPQGREETEEREKTLHHIIDQGHTIKYKIYQGYQRRPIGIFEGKGNPRKIHQT